MKQFDKTRKAQLLEEWQTSSESKSGFATRHGIGQSTFYPWIWNIKNQSSINQPLKGFRAITIEEESSIPSRPVAVIHYPSGVKLELHELPDPMFVKAILELAIEKARAKTPKKTSERNRSHGLAGKPSQGGDCHRDS